MAKKVRQLSNQEIAAFCEQLSFIVKAGITLQEGLVMMAEDLKGGDGAVLLGQLLEHVEMGQPLAYALRESGVFPDYMVNMVQIGEAAGRLEEVLDALTAYYQRSEALSRAIRSSITYPLVMIAVVYSRIPSILKSSRFWLARITEEFFFLTRFMKFRTYSTAVRLDRNR